MLYQQGDVLFERMDEEKMKQEAEKNKAAPIKGPTTGIQA